MTTGVENKDTLDYPENSNSHIISMEAILTRDQRTTSHRVIGTRRNEQNSTPSSIGVMFESVDNSETVNGSLGVISMMNNRGTQSASVSSKIRHCSSRRIRGRSSYRGFTVTWLRLGSLLVTLLVASIHAAPTTMTSKSDMRSDTPPRGWVNPCELPEFVGPIDISVVQVPDYELLNNIVVQTRIAHMEAERFKEKFIKKAFKVKNYDDWSSQHYNWLPSREEIPKDLGEKLDEKFLEKLDLDTALLDAYGYMQKYAVALEQVTWDQLNLTTQDSLYDNFTSTENKLRMVLCEIQVALVERQVPQREDVSRDIMPDDFRAMSKNDTERNLRDWLIFRDYMNGLEYVDQVCDYLRNKSKS